MSNKLHIKNLLNKYGIVPNKVLGQNFLIDERVVEELVGAANISKKDVIVEVGPGTGIITKKLAKKAKKVIAVEKDPHLIPILQKELANFKNVEIINEDILKFKISNNKFQKSNYKNGQLSNVKYQMSSYKLVGAPPYYLTSRLFRHFLENIQVQPLYIAVIIQKEVAKKIVAKPPRSNLLAVSVQFYGKPQIIKIISKSAFWPRPKVDSAILSFSLHEPALQIRDMQIEKHFFKVVRAGFSSPRKQLIVNLTNKLGVSRQQIQKNLEKLNIDPSRRAQTLTVQEWVRLAQLL